jgi:spore coat protein A, manganese oxidase
MPVLLDGIDQFEHNAFKNDLPIPEVIDTSKQKTITLHEQEFKQFLGLYDQNGQPLETTVWGYGTGQNSSYPGPTILANEGQPVTVNWQNQLPVDEHLLPVDPSILDKPLQRALEASLIPTVPHLHGGHTNSAYDGGPLQWFTQSGPEGTGPLEVGPKFVSSTDHYDNTQQAATLWYHDHTTGITRLNVYAGLAGFYVLQDANRLDLEKDHILPSGPYDLNMVIQDRAFTSDGQLYVPAFKGDQLPGTNMTVADLVPETFYQAKGDGAPSILPGFLGDTNLVNGMAWPKLDVAAGDYEFRLLNGSDGRFYVLKLSDPNVAVHLVGTDGGLLPHAQTVIDGDGIQHNNEFIVLGPGERLELVFDFSKLHSGDTVRLENVGSLLTPFQGVSDDGHLLGSVPPAGPNDPEGNIMQFNVNTSLKPFHATVENGTTLVKDFVDLTTDANHDGVADSASHVRKLGAFDTTDQFGRATNLLGKAEAGNASADTTGQSGGDFGPLAFSAPVTEKPLLGTTEQWDIFNFTPETHPIHLHLVQFQVFEKVHIDFQGPDKNGIPVDTDHDGRITYGVGSTPDFTKADIWIGNKEPLRPEDTGPHDTVNVDPHEMVAIVAKFDKPGDYVWHCHILTHEDHDMMRPYTVVDPGLLA